MIYITCLKIRHTQFYLLFRLFGIGDYILTIKDVNLAVIMHYQCPVCPTIFFRFFHPNRNSCDPFRIVLLPWNMISYHCSNVIHGGLEARWSPQCLKQAPQSAFPSLATRDVAKLCKVHVQNFEVSKAPPFLEGCRH